MLPIAFLILVFLTLQAPEVPADYWESEVGIMDRVNSIMPLDGSIAVTSRGGEMWKPDEMDGVYYIDVDSGKVIWHFRTKGDAFGCGSADLDGDGRMEVVIGSRDQKVTCLEGDGKVKWQVETKGYPISTPTIADLNGDGEMEVVIGTTNGTICSLRGSDGAVIWRFKAEGGIIASPAVGDLEGDGVMDVVFGDGKRFIYKLRGDTGLPVWRIKVDDEVDTSPAAADLDGDGRMELITASWGGMVYCLNGGSGEIKWKFQTGGSVISSPSLGDIDRDGKIEVVIGSMDHKLYCLEGSSGKEKWSFQAESPIIASPILGDLDEDGVVEVVACDREGDIYILSGPDGKVETSSLLNGGIRATPLLSDLNGDGRFELILGDDKGKLRRFDTPGGGKLIWAQFQFDSSNTGIMSPLTDADLADVDLPPKLPWMKREAVSVSIGISQYGKYAPEAEFADRDAIVFAEYAQDVLGVPEENLYLLVNEKANKGEFDKLFGERGWISRRVNINPSQTDVFIFYSGHGITSSNSKRFLVPYGSDPNYPESCYSFEKLINSLRKLKAKTITIFIDACFSGMGRKGETLVKHAKWLVLPPIDIETPSGITIFTSSSGSEISLSYPQKRHGLFTYYLLKGLKGEADEDGDFKVTVRELFKFVSRKVRREALRRFDREQTPSLITSDSSRVLMWLKKQ